MTDRLQGEPAGPSAFLVFTLDERRYALPLEGVQKSIRAVAITPLPEAPSVVLGIIDLGGSVIPVIDLRMRFKLPRRELRLSDQFILADTGKRNLALLVDETKGVIEVSPDRYTASGAIIPGLGPVGGALSLDDGMILIHDLELLLSLEEESTIDRAMLAAKGDEDGCSG
ncbi:MAG TPA: chemotaxis protein CheW [Rectinemataceae bacterium]|nr:chemotaxis protein CheW [Rectinemataceae bacterium]